jgi:MFS family permease
MTIADKPVLLTPNINRWRAFALLAVSFFMVVIDLTIVNTSLPTIGRDLHFSETSLQWVVTAYSLTFGGFLLLGGRAADLLGRRRVLMLGLSVFTAASLACGLATGEAFLIGSRAVQGLGAAIMLPAALSIVMNMFQEGAERNKALGIWGALGATGATVGLITGGILTRYAGWQYIFYLNVPIGAAALALAPRIVPTSASPRRAGGSTCSARSPAQARWCCSCTRSPGHRSTAGAPRERSRCSRRPRLCSLRSW